jgi:hypothetical protein
VNKTLKYIFAVLVVILIGLGAFAGGFVTGHMLPLTGLSLPGEAIVAPATVSPEQQAATPADEQALFAPFWQAWNLGLEPRPRELCGSTGG